MHRDFSRIKDKHFDVLICGGGIYGGEGDGLGFGTARHESGCCQSVRLGLSYIFCLQQADVLTAPD